MKILTLNTHSLIEEHYEEKLTQFVSLILQEQPDIIALQEVNQSALAPLADPASLAGYVPCAENEIPVREDNHAARAAQLLRQAGLSYSWTWVPAKLGYGKYDEGLALFSRSPIIQTDAFYISHSQDYSNWKTRKVLGIRTQDWPDWFYTVHLGWWSDPEEPFQVQWQKLTYRLGFRKADGNVWLMGDFNSPAEVRDQGYDCISRSGWADTWMLAEKKDSGITVEGIIDGWRELLKDSDSSGMRIDHIWCQTPVPIQKSEVVFNRINGPVVSDHFGVLIETPDPSYSQETR